MSVKGGYKILNLEGYSLTAGVPTTVPGAYEEIENAYRKPILVSDLYVDGKEFPDVFVCLAENMGDYQGKVPGGVLKITADDEVTYTVDAV